MAGVMGEVRQASDSPAMALGARLGLGARAAIYLLMGVLALRLALGQPTGQENDQRGAMQEVAQQTGGKVLLAVLALGFAGYALWRFSEATFGVVVDGRGAGARLKSLFRGLVYASFAVTAATILAGAGSGKSQAGQQKGLTARVMQQTGGRWLVGLVGLAVAAAGLAMVVEGVKKKFERYLRMHEMSAGTRSAVQKLGMIGTIARGLVIALSGVLVVQAAVQYDADKAGGLDAALRTLADRPFGRVLLGIGALGLVAFGIYGMAEAKWRRT